MSIGIATSPVWSARPTVWCAAVVLLALHAAPAAAGGLASVPPAELVRQLGSSSFDERTQAHAELKRRGPAVADALRRGMQDADLELRRRCMELLRQIEDAELRARVLTPHPLRLHYDNALVSSAVRAIEQRTGFAIELAAELREHRVSVDTGLVPFWQAWARFCTEAGACEETETYERPGPVSSLRVLAGQGTAPTCVSGPLRVRALPVGLEWRQWPPPDGFLTRYFGGPVATVLEVRADPEAVLLAIDSVNIRAARDNQGKRIALTIPAPQRLSKHPATLLLDPQGRPVLAPRSWLIPVWLPGLAQLAPPRELEGTVDARFLVQQVCVSVAAPLEAMGKTFAGMRDVTLSVEQVETDDQSATFTLRLDHLDPLLALCPPDQAQRVRPGVVASRSPRSLLLDGVELRDAKDRPLPRTGSAERLDSMHSGDTFRVTFTDVPADTRALRLVLVARLVARVELAFALRGP